MSAPGLALSELELSRAPGFSAPFSVSTGGAGLVVVVGPNESGKSTLARGLFWILWPELCTNPAVELAARFRFGERDLSARLFHGQTKWQDELGEAFTPGLPPADLAECFRLSVEDRDGDAVSNRVLAERVGRALAGGYDLGAAREQLRPKEPMAAGKLRKSCDDARRQVQEIEREQTNLADQELGLEALRAELDVCRGFEREEPLLVAALRVREARAKLERIGVELAALADSQRVSSKDLEHLDNEQHELEDRETSLRDAQLDWQSRCARHRGHPLAEHGLDADSARARLEDARQLVNRERERDGAQQAFEQAQAAVRRWSEAESAGQHPLPGPEELKVIDRLSSDWQAAEAEAKAARVLLSIVPARAAMPKPAAGGGRGRLAAVAWVLALACIAVGAYAAFAFHPAFAFLALGGVLGAVAIAMLLVGPPPAAPVGIDPEQQARGFAEARIAEGEAKLAALKPEHDRIEQRYGLRPGLGLVISSDILRVRAQAFEQMDVARVALETAERRHDELRDSLAEFLARHGREPAASAAGVHEEVRGLCDELARCHELRESAAEAERARERAERAVAETRQRIERIFTEAGLPPGDEARLAALVEGRKQHDELVKEQAVQKHELAAATQLLGERGEASFPSSEGLQQRLAQAREKRERIQELHESIREVEREVGRRREQDALESARAGLVQAESRLALVREAAVDAALAEVVLDDVERDLQGGGHAPVLARAQELFGRFTRGRHTLQLAARARQGQEFLARDQVLDRDVALEQLSSGTRVQLLLAARLAFAMEAAERAGARPPLILDEALATTDESRFAAVADAMGHFVADGWQVIYLTSQRSDVERWRQRSLRAGADAPCVIDLGVVRGLASAAPIEELVAVPTAPVPMPGESSPEDYARTLGVPALDLERPLGEQHVFHLLRDRLGIVRELTVLEASQLGVAERLAAGGEGSLGALTAAQREHLGARIASLRAFHELWSIGRGRAVDSAVLSDAGVTEVFLEEVAALARRHGGDAKLLIDALRRNEVKGFGTQKTSGLDSALQDSGHLQRADPLAFEDVVWRTAERSKLPADEVRELCTQWWSAAERAWTSRRSVGGG